MLLMRDAKFAHIAFCYCLNVVMLLLVPITQLLLLMHTAYAVDE